MTRGDCIREITVASFVLNLSLTPMGKHLGINLLDGSILIYECLTAITWKSEKLSGKHTGVALVTNNFVYEVAREGIEHKMIQMLEKHRHKFHEEYKEARVGFEEEADESKGRSGRLNMS